MINCRALEKKKAENIQEEENQNQGIDHQSTKEQEGSKANESSNEKSQNLPNPEITQKQQNEEVNSNNKKDRKKKTKQKKPKKLPKKKSKVVFKPSNSKRREESVSTTKQNDFSRQSIEESILRLTTKYNTCQQEQTDENINKNSSEI